MENRLKQLKRAMKKTVFSNLNFTETQKAQLKSKLATMDVKSEEEIIISVLQLLAKEKTGFELNKKIRARGIQNFENSEGQLYMLLHKLEQKGYLQSFWAENDVKYYRVTNKGNKLLSLAEEKTARTKSIFKEILEG